MIWDLARQAFGDHGLAFGSRVVRIHPIVRVGIFMVGRIYEMKNQIDLLLERIFGYLTSPVIYTLCFIWLCLPLAEK